MIVHKMLIAIMLVSICALAQSETYNNIFQPLNLSKDSWEDHEERFNLFNNLVSDSSDKDSSSARAKNIFIVRGGIFLGSHDDDSVFPILGVGYERFLTKRFSLGAELFWVGYSLPVYGKVNYYFSEQGSLRMFLSTGVGKLFVGTFGAMAGIGGLIQRTSYAFTISVDGFCTFKGQIWLRMSAGAGWRW
ncbi:MAG: hypothetical protein A2Y62_16910 [Candidatus Fischerbacteria bacterium RBG_13_37_8]|uniref:Outer membrane protein beta-barrel domain-containing protein n=1 Tax=Candidatus Fischerbacteria bacterium RBG_13_37_8 TaxID=1817863 RepID=A0A1F5VE00_9BACT|nr:MAG: hypothetical protein A2Y62_16910 [Candidatus Fischerbacteria bacterium RBG_13_37_8]